MEKHVLGKTGLEVSRLGVGLAELGDLHMDEAKQAEQVLNLALDNGINFFDTAACYRNSEELIGRTVAHRRDEFILATKAGHVVGDYEGESWTAQTILDSIDRSLRRLRTDYVDLVQLHSCGVDILERGEVIEALEQAKQAGKTRFIGYSGDNEAALWAVKSGRFDTLQTSYSLVDQHARTRLFGPVEEQNMGLIVKRPIANGVWADYVSSGPEEYRRRAREMKGLGPLPNAPDDGILLALGFVFVHEAPDTFIVGTRDPDHMRQNIEWVNNEMPVSQDVVEELYRRFDTLEQNWRQRG